MSSIWEFLYQTLTVSLAAAALLLVKWPLSDKLSPRWQYGVWAVLALRALIPASLSRGIVPQLALWLETAKSAAELRLSSAYSEPFGLMDLRSPLPWPEGAPKSLTDWLFIAYFAGAALTLLWYAWRYASLRALLLRGREPSGEAAAVIERVAAKYKLRACRAVEVPGLKSAFVCGVFRPVLALPEGETPDEKVILHELLHLKYFDAGQNVFWCVLRALHWCNPFLQYVFNRVGNDMESLCDRRVLERLEGEERREYGSILLGMASGSYARAPGTSSISNGARNIARRIEAIARFKLYPRGMALVSACAVLLLASTLLTGARAEPEARDNPGTSAEALAALTDARVFPCASVPAAIDSYVKGALLGNFYAQASVSPADEYGEIYDAFCARIEDGWTPPEAEYGYRQLVLSPRLAADGVWRASVAVDEFVLSVIAVDNELRGEAEAGHDRMYLIPLEIREENGGYTVRGGAGRWIYADELDSEVISTPDSVAADNPEAVAPAYTASAETPAGTLSLSAGSSTYIALPDYYDDDGWLVSTGAGFSGSGHTFSEAEWGGMFFTGWTLTLDASALYDAGEVSSIMVKYAWEAADAPTEYPASGTLNATAAELAESGGVLSVSDWPDWNLNIENGEAPYYPRRMTVEVYIDGENMGEYTLELAEAAE